MKRTSPNQGLVPVPARGYLGNLVSGIRSMAFSVVDGSAGMTVDNYKIGIRPVEVAG